MDGSKAYLVIFNGAVSIGYFIYNIFKNLSVIIQNFIMEPDHISSISFEKPTPSELRSMIRSNSNFDFTGENDDCKLQRPLSGEL